MVSTGTVREWWADEGWGILTSPETPSGCWAHFSTLRIDGYRTLVPGQRVSFEWESPGQDGYGHRAVWVAPIDDGETD